MNRLVLGTAQLGMHYGIANRSGQPDMKTAEAIIKTAWESGISEFDTAPAYGESQYVLGKALSLNGLGSRARIISKFHPDLDHLDGQAMTKALELTLTSLSVDALYGIMLHKEEYLDLWDKGLGETLTGFVTSGLVHNLGVSVYMPDRAVQALMTDGISSVNLPSNILDRRFEKAGVFKLAQEKKKQIYVRSVFLQGLLFMDNDNIPGNMKFAAADLQGLESLAQAERLSKQDLALAYVRDAYPDAKIVFGVETLKQLRENLSSWNKRMPTRLLESIPGKFARVENKVVNPALWPVQN